VLVIREFSNLSPFDFLKSPNSPPFIYEWEVSKSLRVPEQADTIDFEDLCIYISYSQTNFLLTSTTSPHSSVAAHTDGMDVPARLDDGTANLVLEFQFQDIQLHMMLGKKKYIYIFKQKTCGFGIESQILPHLMVLSEPGAPKYWK